MISIGAEPELAALLKRFHDAGGDLDFVFLPYCADDSPQQIHQRAADEALKAMNDWFETSPCLFRISWDLSRARYGPISWQQFWGTDDAEEKQFRSNSWRIPIVDGYKTEFYQPPHGLGVDTEERRDLFERITRLVFGNEPEKNEIFSWSSDWSNYFDSGNEWWGSFFWTIRLVSRGQMVVIGASSTD